MKIDIRHYNYSLPDEKIARYPQHPRDESKLLVYKNGVLAHRIFKTIGEHLPQNSHLVLNNTKVIPARLYFTRKTGALIEIFLLNPEAPSTVLPVVMDECTTVKWHCVIGNKRRWKGGETLEGNFTYEGQTYVLRASLEEPSSVIFSWEGGMPFSAVVMAYGNLPLPPYLKRESEDSDKTDYQTVYSQNEGAVAAPTAGLHFTEAVFEDVEARGISKSFVTLHVGAGTFMPVKEENALEHPMHSEQIIADRTLLTALIENEGPVIPVGTTSMRSLESMYWWGVKILEGAEFPLFVEKLFPYEKERDIPAKLAFRALRDWMGTEEQAVGSTEIMIFPSYKFRVCSGLITNFHQPSSTLLLLVAALVGEEGWKEIYREALENDYRFLSFGDSSLLLP
jgi:S-adenosylmethionine:tRNA ribosyltransferase-isomerase